MRTQSDTIPPSIPPRGKYVRVSRAMPHRRPQCRQCEPVNLLIASLSPFLAAAARAKRRDAPPAWTAFLPAFKYVKRAGLTAAQTAERQLRRSPAPSEYNQAVRRR